MRSYKSINYNVRVAKSIERRMLVETFSRLSEFGRMADLMYIGMGSVFFTDFILFRRLCGFTHMLSIEHPDSQGEIRRFKLNKPFDEVELEFESAAAMLARRPWTKPGKIPAIWLDYDNVFNLSIIDDMVAAVGSVPSGSFIAISYQTDLTHRIHDEATANPAVENAVEDGAAAPPPTVQAKVDRLRYLVGEQNLPLGVKERDLKPKLVAGVFRDILDHQVQRALSDRNSGLDLASPSRIIATQIVHFRYSDGAPMATVGYVIHEAGDQLKVDRCRFSEMEFYASGSDAFSIEPPLITPLEAKMIDHAKHQGARNKSSEIWPIYKDDLPLTPNIISSYRKVSRYFPPFAQVEI